MSTKKIDNFFECNNKCRYKFNIDTRENVFIVEIEKTEHIFVIAWLQDCFKVLNEDNVNNLPIDVGGVSSRKNSFGLLRLFISFTIFSCPIIAHYRPHRRGKLAAPNVIIYPSLDIISKLMASQPNPHNFYI